MFWITLSELQSWLYFTSGEQKIVTNCNNQKENKIMMRNTGKFMLGPKCKLTTPEVTLKTTSQLHSKFIMAYLLKFNIISIQEPNDENNVKLLKKLKLKQVIDNPIKLIKLSNSLNEINKELKKNEENILHNKYFVYPVRSVTIITIILVIIGLALCVSKKRRRNNRMIPIFT